MECDREHFSDDDSHSLRSNSTPHSDDEDKHIDEFPHSPPQKYLEESPPHDSPESFARQQRELLERLKEQFTSFPFTQHAPNFAGIDLPPEQAQLRLQAEAQNDFPFSFPTPPPSKGEDDVKISSSTSGKKSNQNNSWSYEDQFKQVRQLYEINEDPKRKEFLDDLFMFMKDRGTPINRLPIMAKSVLDLYELYKLVIGRGGLVNVINKKLWQEIIKDLNLPSSITSAAFTLRTQYTKYLYPYECEKFNLSSDSELQAAIENNKRDGSRRSTASSYGSYGPQSPQTHQINHQQLQMAMATQLQQQQNVNNPGLSTSNGSGSIPPTDLPNTQQIGEMQLAQQRFMMMMFLYNQFLQAQSQST